MDTNPCAGGVAQVRSKEVTITPSQPTYTAGFSYQAHVVSDGTLWAWAKGDGLAQLDIETAQGTLMLPSEALLEDLASSRNGKYLYGSLQVQLWRYEPETEILTLQCTDLGLETEAVEMLLDGKLLLGRHEDKTLLLHALDIQTCAMVDSLNIPIPYNDVEGLALPYAACVP